MIFILALFGFFLFRNLPVNIHKYYAMFKFFEYLEFYDINAVAAICRAFTRHDFILGKNHPISRSNCEEIVEKMNANVSDLTEFNTMQLVRYSYYY